MAKMAEKQAICSQFGSMIEVSRRYWVIEDEQFLLFLSCALSNRKILTALRGKVTQVDIETVQTTVTRDDVGGIAQF